MSAVLEALKKRMKYPVDFGDQKFFVRAMKPDEIDGLKSISGESAAQCAFLGCCLLEEDGSQVMPRNDGESFSDFAARAVDVFQGGVPMDLFHALRKGVEKATNPPSDEVLRGN